MILNVGCGTALRENAINMDIRRLPDTICGDIRAIPFGPEYFDEIYAIDIIEHLTQSDAAVAMSEVSRVLRQGGKAIFQLPSLRGIIEAYAAGADAEKVSWWLFGGQDYKENYHYAVYDEESFTRLAASAELFVKNIEDFGTNMRITVEKP